ncbi:MAG: magnesium and cobalt transport protein CorA [Candidatus Melainabacteria bacterium]|nr:MAG: magnesium and cobalt transport protein CorA [Candidatus Melainabacteria bacterium]
MSKKGRRSKIPRARRQGHMPAAVLEQGSPHGDKDSPGKILVTAYDPERLEEKQVSNPAELSSYLKSWRVVWIDVEGLGGVDLIDGIAKQFQIHHLVIEDILNAHQRAKLEQYGDNFFLVTHIVTDAEVIEPKQVSFFIGKNYVISFQDEPLDSLQSLRERIRNEQSLVRAHGSDYLVYALVDAVIDSYFPVLERLGERLEDLEDYVIDNPTRESIAQIHIIKRELLILRRAIWPLREAINSLLRDGTSILGEEARLHLRDSYDHAVRVLDFIETYREVGADLMDVYLSSVSNRMNEVMKVLTIITTIFTPPMLIASIYGMTFDPNVSPFNMPEVKWYYGYPLALAAMLLSAFGMMTFLRLRGFLGGRVNKQESGAENNPG